MSAKVWYLAVGQKKVGPVSEEEVKSRIASGKLPDKAVAWKDGMAGWSNIKEVPEFAAAFAALDAPAEPEPAPEPAPAPVAAAPAPAPKKKTGRKPRPEPQPEAAEADAEGGEKKGGGLREFFFPSSVNLGFKQPFRIGWKDVFRAFGTGMAVNRLKTVLIVGGIAAALLLVLGGISFVSMNYIHMIVALPFVFLLFVGLVVLGSVAMGALSFQTREQLVNGRCPGPKEALGEARKHIMALVLTPLAIFGLMLVAVIVLAILNVLGLIPFVGPLITGLIFIVHIAVGGLIFFLALTQQFSVFMGPVIVGFEGSGVKDTIKILFDYVRRSTVRFVLYGFLPNLVYSIFTSLVVGVAAGMLAAPVGMGTQFQTFHVRLWYDSVGISTLSYGVYLSMFWVAVFGFIVLGLLASVANAIVSFLYLAGRKGNDECIDYNTYLARREDG